MNRFIPGHGGGTNPAANDIQGAIPAEDDKKLGEAPKNDIAPNAQVWKKYVDETDRYDTDMVKGWDNSLDVLLIFAALFSAISAAFVLESTQDLKPGYAESSAQTLAAILLAVSAGSSSNTSDISENNQSDFTPSSTAITVNILWFMSLSLSVAVALIAIVAKDWCYQFMSGRTGQFILQGRRRQLRWEGIEKWKMQGMLNVLPLMMHAALLLFAVGLSIYLWDISPRVALPVVVTTILVGLFYVVTLLLPLFFRYCPFTTGFIKMLLPSWYKVAGTVLEPVLQVFGWLLVPVLATRAAIKHCIHRGLGKSLNSKPGGSKLSLRRWVIQIPFRSFWTGSWQSINDRIHSISDTSTTDKSKLDNQDTPTDDVTSSMLGWMIAQCEDPNSVDIALEALVCAKPWIPRDLLVRCRAFEAAVIRLSTSVAAWENSSRETREEPKVVQHIFLQSQCLSMMSHMDVVDLPEGYLETIRNLWILLDVSWDQDKDYCLASKELGSLSLHLGDQWQEFNFYREQVDRQWDLIRMIVSKEAISLRPADLCHLVDGIAKSYLYEPDQSPSPLLDLLAMSEYANNDQLRRMIGIALTTACIANYDYPGCSPIPDWPARQKRARSVYIELTTTRPLLGWGDDHNALLAFGLLGAFFAEPGSDWRLDRRQAMDLMIDIGVYGLTSIVPSALGLPKDPLTTALRWLLDTAHTSARISSPGSPSSENAGEVAIEMTSSNSTSQARRREADVCGPAKERFQDPAYLEHAAQLLRLLRNSANPTWRRIRESGYYLVADKQMLDTVLESNLYRRTRQAIDSETSDTVPHCMSFVWAFTRCLLTLWHYSTLRSKPDVPSILEPFCPPGDLPDDVGGMGFAETWIGKLEEACQRNPQNALDSEVLNEMIEYYREDEHQDLRPSSEGGSDAEPSRTWLEILTDLRQNARLGGMMQAHARTQSPRSTEIRGNEAAHVVIGNEATEEPGDRRVTAEGMQLDQSPPAAHE